MDYEKNRLRELLKDKRYTNRQFAEEIGYNECTVSLWVNNHLTPSLPTIKKICSKLDVSFEEFWAN